MKIDIIEADYNNKKHAKDILYLLNSYSRDPMGGGKALESFVLDNLIQELAKRPYAISLLCYVDNAAVGLINSFEAFSTFSCKPLINIHDIIVLKKFRGNNLSQMMLENIELIAKKKGCCKLTLEVLSQNIAAKKSYQKFGFTQYQLDPKVGQAEFWHKHIKPN